MKVVDLYNDNNNNMIVLTTSKSKRLSGRFTEANLPTKCWSFKVKDYHKCHNGIIIINAVEE